MLKTDQPQVSFLRCSLSCFVCRLFSFKEKNISFPLSFLPSPLLSFPSPLLSPLLFPPPSSSLPLPPFSLLELGPVRPRNPPVHASLEPGFHACARNANLLHDCSGLNFSLFACEVKALPTESLLIKADRTEPWDLGADLVLGGGGD